MTLTACVTSTTGDVTHVVMRTSEKPSIDAFIPHALLSRGKQAGATIE